MSGDAPDCPRCRLYQGEVALLRAEIAGLRNSVLALTSQRAESATVLEVLGLHEPQRLAISGPLRDGPDLFYQVSLTYRDLLSARCAVRMDNPAAFRNFFEDLARHKTGWEEAKCVSTPEGQLAITCTYEGKLFRPEISMDVSCALDDPSFDPYWAVQLHLDVDPMSLDDLAGQAQALFRQESAIP